jgi:hypothetical protein
MFQVDREIAAKIGARSFHFVDFILVEPDPIESAETEEEAQRYNHEKRGDLMLCGKRR